MFQCNVPFLFEWQSDGDWGQGDAFLDIFPDDLLNNVEHMDSPNDFLDKILMGDDPFCSEKFQDEQPLFSSGASDSGLSSENLDL